jgi:DNA-binding LytR/AlgR family response regulator
LKERRIGMNWNIAIADDLENDRLRLERDVRKWFDDQEESVSVLCCPDGESLLGQTTRGTFHLAFLDIQMGPDRMDGIELARRIREIDSQLLVVFLTTSKEYAFDAFPIHPFDYLIKPYNEKTLDRVLTEAMRVLSDKEPEITVRIARADYRIPMGKIISALSQGHTVEIRTTDGELLKSSMTFAEIEAQLTADPRFLTCNRGILVNMDHVLSLTEDSMQMSDGKMYPMRTRGRAELITAFSQYQISRMKRGVR